MVSKVVITKLENDIIEKFDCGDKKIGKTASTFKSLTTIQADKNLLNY
jgi:hypothetical protein